MRHTSIDFYWDGCSAERLRKSLANSTTGLSLSWFLNEGKCAPCKPPCKPSANYLRIEKDPRGDVKETVPRFVTKRRGRYIRGGYRSRLIFTVAEVFSIVAAWCGSAIGRGLESAASTESTTRLSLAVFRNYSQRARARGCRCPRVRLKYRKGKHSVTNRADVEV